MIAAHILSDLCTYHSFKSIFLLCGILEFFLSSLVFPFISEHIWHANVIDGSDKTGNRAKIQSHRLPERAAQTVRRNLHAGNSRPDSPRKRSQFLFFCFSNFIQSIATLLSCSDATYLSTEYPPPVNMLAPCSGHHVCANTRVFHQIQTELLNTIRRLEREISLVSTAWYNVHSRLPSSNVTVSRYRHPASTSAGGGAETKQSWLAKQRGIVAGSGGN